MGACRVAAGRGGHGPGGVAGAGWTRGRVTRAMGARPMRGQGGVREREEGGLTGCRRVLGSEAREEDIDGEAERKQAGVVAPGGGGVWWASGVSSRSYRERRGKGDIL